MEDGTIIQVRKPSVPDPEQAKIFQELGIEWKQACPVLKSIKK